MAKGRGRERVRGRGRKPLPLVTIGSAIGACIQLGDLHQAKTVATPSPSMNNA